jgi:hypothetical protein
MVERARLFEGKKFLWDGVDYESVEEARSAAKAYGEEGFEVEVWLDSGKAYVYTRRVAKEDLK